MGDKLYEGLGVTQDYTKAAMWYELAAENGSTKAQYKLGNLYEEGKGVSRSLVQAHRWLNIAATKRSKVAAGQKGSH